MLTANYNCEKIVAFKNMPKDGMYFCPECGETLIAKTAGRFKTPHFSHKKSSQCEFGAGESKKHMEIKLNLAKRLERHGYMVDVERRIGQHITDVYAEKDKRIFCFEIQLSPISTDEIISRMDAFSSIGAATVWVFNLDDIEDGQEIRTKRTWMLLQRLQFGVSCFAGPDGNLSFIRLGPCFSWVEETDYGGGFYRRLKTRKIIRFLKKEIGLDDLIINHVAFEDSKIRTYKVDYSLIDWDKDDEP